MTAQNVKLIGRYALAASAVAISMFPFVWMARTSVAARESIVVDGLSPVPSSYDLSNYARAWQNADLGTAMLNGAMVTCGILILQLLTCVPAAFALAKGRFRGRSFVFYVVLACLLVPAEATALPLFLGISQLGLADTQTALILPFATSAFGIFMLRQHMVTIPDALLDAARADGLGIVATLRRVVVPASMPAITTFAVFSVFIHWNDYLWPLLVARDPELRTPPMALALFQQSDTGQDFGALAAGAVIITLPIVGLFLLVQRRFIAGVAGGELPG